MIQFLIRVVRKLAHIGFLIFSRTAHFFARLEDKALRILLGTDYSIKARGDISVEEKIFSSLKYITPLNPSLPAVGRPAKVSLLLPSLVSRGFYGGVATALIFAAKLAGHKEMPLRIIQTSEPGNGDGLSEFFKANGININRADVEIVDISGRRFNFYGYLEMRPDDIFIASAWWDAHLLEKLPLTHRFIYMIQDYEPIFYPNGDMSVLAERTYHSKRFIPVLNTKLMHEFMSQEGYDYIRDNGVWFEPAVSRVGTSASKPARGSKKRLFLYGRPNVERNLFFMALEAINACFVDSKLLASEWDIFMAGQDNIPDIRLSNGSLIKNLGKMTMDDYVEFSKTVDLAVSPMMAPHPNYPTLEFASIGAAVVTTRWKTKQSLERYSKNIVMCDLSAESMAEAIAKAASLSLEERKANTEKQCIGQDWDEAFKTVLPKIDKALEAQVGSDS